MEKTFSPPIKIFSINQFWLRYEHTKYRRKCRYRLESTDGDNRKWEYQELKKATGLRDRELNSAIGWLAREGKIQFDDSQNKDQQSLYIELSLYIG